ncbi:F-box/WD repeat-containing protein 7 isoform X2 [Halyomorpha halys]|nr:F-box/WD repeat-containing protein 7-like isoform X2 [Halyomorpha halys]
MCVFIVLGALGRPIHPGIIPWRELRRKKMAATTSSEGCELEGDKTDCGGGLAEGGLSPPDQVSPAEEDPPATTAPADFVSPFVSPVLANCNSTNYQCRTPYRKRKSESSLDLRSQLPCKKLFPEDSPSNNDYIWLPYPDYSAKEAKFLELEYYYKINYISGYVENNYLWLPNLGWFRRSGTTLVGMLGHYYIKRNWVSENMKNNCNGKKKQQEPPPNDKQKQQRIPSVSSSKDIPPPEMSEWLSQFQKWTNAERILAINRLVESCEPSQVRHMMQLIEPQFQRDFISLLPKELALLVLSFLEPKDLLRAAQTCRNWRFLAEDNLLWREKCRQAGITRESPSHGNRRIRHRSPSTPASPWKAAFMRQHRIEMNWRVKPIRPPKVLKGHDDHVITCLQFSGSRIVSGSDDNTLKVWSATTGKCLRTLVGHTGGVWSSQMSGSTIISGSTDRTLKVWNAETGQCIHTLYGHTSTVRCMHLHEKKVVSGSRDATLRVWDVDSGECLHVLVGHLAAVRCVQYNGKLVVSGAYDYMVKVWDPEREECLHTLQGHTNRVYSLQFDGIHVVSGSLDTSIRVWEVESGVCKHTLMGHQSLTSGMELDNNILVSGNADSTVKVWDIITGQCLQTLSGANKHQSAVTCLQFNNRFVITSSDDGTVKLWDVKTGEFIRNLVSLGSGGNGGVVWRIRANETKLVCAVGSRNGNEETKLLVLDFDVDSK